MTRLGSLAAFAAFGWFWGAWAVCLPAIKEQTGASVEGLGAALLLIAAAALPAMLATGVLIDRVGPKLIPLAAALFGLAVVLPGFAESVWVLAAVLVVVGLASGMLDVSINYGATSIEACGGAPIIQKAHASFSGGFLVASVLAGAARGAGAEPLAILLPSAGVALAAAWLNRGARTLPAPSHEVGGRRLRLTRPLIILGLLCGLAFVVESGIEHWSALFLETELGASPAVGGLGPAFFATAMVLGRTLGDRLAKRLDDAALLVSGALLAAGGLALAAASPTVPPAVAGFFLGGAGISVAAPAFFGAGGRGATARDRGSSVATVTTVSYLGFICGPPIVGAVSGALDLRAGIGLLGAVAVLVAVGTASLRGALPLRRLQPAPRGSLP